MAKLDRSSSSSSEDKNEHVSCARETTTPARLYLKPPLRVQAVMHHAFLNIIALLMTLLLLPMA
jgi:hypothetical protein